LTQTEGHDAPELSGGAASLAVGKAVWGYVKTTSSKGCFVSLARNLDAYIRLCNLSEQYVSDPAREYPAGMLVQCRILTLDANRGRVEATLKMDQVRARFAVFCLMTTSCLRLICSV